MASRANDNGFHEDPDAHLHYEAANPDWCPRFLDERDPSTSDAPYPNHYCAKCDGGLQWDRQRIAKRLKSNFKLDPRAPPEARDPHWCPRPGDRRDPAFVVPPVKYPLHHCAKCDGGLQWDLQKMRERAKAAAANPAPPATRPANAAPNGARGPARPANAAPTGARGSAPPKVDPRLSRDYHPFNNLKLPDDSRRWLDEISGTAGPSKAVRFAGPNPDPLTPPQPRRSAAQQPDLDRIYRQPAHGLPPTIQGYYAANRHLVNPRLVHPTLPEQGYRPWSDAGRRKFDREGCAINVSGTRLEGIELMIELDEKQYPFRAPGYTIYRH